MAKSEGQNRNTGRSGAYYVNASGELVPVPVEFHNQCHTPEDGRFCEGSDGPGRKRDPGHEDLGKRGFESVRAKKLAKEAKAEAEAEAKATNKVRDVPVPADANYNPNTGEKINRSAKGIPTRDLRNPSVEGKGRLPGNTAEERLAKYKESLSGKGEKPSFLDRVKALFGIGNDIKSNIKSAMERHKAERVKVESAEKLLESAKTAHDHAEDLVQHIRKASGRKTSPERTQALKTLLLAKSNIKDAEEVLRRAKRGE